MTIYHSELAARKTALATLQQGGSTLSASLNVLAAADVAGDYGWITEFFTERTDDELSDFLRTLRAYGRDPDGGLGSNALAKDGMDKLVTWVEEWAAPTVELARADLREFTDITDDEHDEEWRHTA